MDKFEPMNDRIVIKRDASEERTASGLYIPQQAREESTLGVVVAVGPGAVAESGVRVEPRVKVGDRVLFGKFSGTEVKLDGVEFVIMREDDIYGVFKLGGES